MSAVERLQLDHLVYCVPGSLEDAAREFERLTGVAPMRGGTHVGLGTHNYIAALDGGAYFEILARDPEQPEPPTTWMAIDAVVDAPRITTFAVKRRDLDAAVATSRAAGYDPRDAKDFERRTADGSRTLRWRLAYNHFYEPLPGAGCAPFLIRWDPECADILPATVAPKGCELVGLRAEACNVEEAAAALAALGVDAEAMPLSSRIPAADGQASPSYARLVATLRTPKGLVEFG